MTKWSLAFFAVLLVAVPVSAQKGKRWEKLGERTVKLRAEKDVIHVGAREGRFSKIKLKVHDNGVRMLDLKLYFANGQVEDVAVRGFIKAGGQTRVIDIRGRKRILRKVEFRYETEGAREGKARVVLWGRH